MSDAGPDTSGFVARIPLTDSVHDRILELIMDGTLAPGEPLRVVPLAQRLGVSQTPVREALGRLAGSSLIERAPMRGFTVAPLLDAEETAALMRARIVLECALVAEAVGSDELAGALAENVARTRSVTVGPTYEEYREYLELSAEFHALIARAGGNRFLSSALDALPVHMQRFRLFGPDGVDDVPESTDEHAAIAEAISQGDAEAARAAMERHVRGVAARSQRAASAARAD